MLYMVYIVVHSQDVWQTFSPGVHAALPVLLPHRTTNQLMKYYCRGLNSYHSYDHVCLTQLQDNMPPTCLQKMLFLHMDIHLKPERSDHKN